MDKVLKRSEVKAAVEEAIRENVRLPNGSSEEITDFYLDIYRYLERRKGR